MSGTPGLGFFRLWPILVTDITVITIITIITVHFLLSALAFGWLLGWLIGSLAFGWLFGWLACGRLIGSLAFGWLFGLDDLSQTVHSEAQLPDQIPGHFSSHLNNKRWIYYYTLICQTLSCIEHLLSDKRRHHLLTTMDLLLISYDLQPFNG